MPSDAHGPLPRHRMSFRLVAAQTVRYAAASMRKIAAAAFGFRVVVSLFVFGNAASAQWTRTPDPEPFRRYDVLRGRDYALDDAAFLHRFSYRFLPRQERSWRRNPQGFRTSVGSVRSDDFHVLQELRKDLSLSENLFFALRHKRDEDLDGRYERTLTGLGLTWGDGWSACVSGDIVGDKADINGELEVGWRDGTRRRVRLAAVATDMTLNRKSERETYERQPFTGFAEVFWTTPSDNTFQVWANWNLPLAWQLPAESLRLEYEQVSAGAEIGLVLSPQWRLSLDAEWLAGDRNWFPDGGSLHSERSESREYAHAGFEAARRQNANLLWWTGIRYLRFEEEEAQEAVSGIRRNMRRREHIWHAGVDWALSAKWHFQPALYVDRLDIARETTEDPRSKSRREGVISKIAFPLARYFANDAVLTLNQTLRLDRARSGGTHVSLILPF